MIFLDTNVVAESMRRNPSERVIAWLSANDSAIALSTIVIAEIAFGIERIRPEERSMLLWKQLEARRDRFADRIHTFDEGSALIYGEIAGRAARQGRTLASIDAMIAAVALRNKGALATRNVRDFVVPDLVVIDPWNA